MLIGCFNMLNVASTLLKLGIGLVCFFCQVPRVHCLVHRKLGVHDFIIGSPMREVPGFFLSLLDLIVYFPILQYVIDSVNQANKL